MNRKTLGVGLAILLAGLLLWLLQPEAADPFTRIHAAPKAILPVIPEEEIPPQVVLEEAVVPVNSVVPLLTLEAEAELPPAPLTVAVRDLRDGSPLPAFRLRLLTGATATPGRSSENPSPTGSQVVTDATGEVRLDGSSLLNLEPVEDSWGVPHRWTQARVKETGVLWVYHWVDYRAAISFSDPSGAADHGPIGLQVHPDLTGNPALDTDPTSPRSAAWWREMGLDGLVERTRTSSSEVLEFRCPDFGPGAIAATCPGWLAAEARVERPVRSDTNGIAFRFARARRIAGTLRDEAGRPLPGKRVRVYTTRLMKFADWDLRKSLEWSRKGGIGVTAALYEGKDLAAVTFHAEAFTGPDGGYQLGVLQDGTSQLVVWEEGTSFLSRDLGELHADASGVDLVLRSPTSGDRLLVLSGGRPAPRASLLVADLTVGSGFPQPGIQITLDAESRLSASCLTVGHDYAFRLSGLPGLDDRCVFLAWNGESTVDLSDLRLLTDVLTERGR